LASDYQLSQRRISAIVQRVGRWVAGGEKLPTVDHRQLDQWLRRERAQAVYDRALRAFDHGPKELKTVRRGERDGKPFEEETRRELPPSSQLLRVAVSACRELDRAGEASAAAEVEPDEESRRQATLEHLTELRDKAEAAGLTEWDLRSSEALMADLLKMVAGEPHGGWALKALKGDENFRQRQRQENAAPQSRKIESPTPVTPSLNTEADMPSPKPHDKNAEPDVVNSQAETSAHRAASNCSTCSNPTPTQKAHDERQVITIQVLPSMAAHGSSDGCVQRVGPAGPGTPGRSSGGGGLTGL
jgi:hypothetical protein